MEAFPCVSLSLHWCRGKSQGLVAPELGPSVGSSFSTQALRFSSTAEHWRWGWLSGAGSKRFSASSMVRVSGMSCLFPQSVLSCWCPSSSFHSALHTLPLAFWEVNCFFPGGDRMLRMSRHMLLCYPCL